MTIRRTLVSAAAVSASLLSISMSSTAAPSASSEPLWISLGDAAYVQLKLLAPQAHESGITAAAPVVRGQERLHLVEVEQQLLPVLSASLHRTLHRCGGFMVHTSEAAGIAALTSFRPQLTTQSQPQPQPQQQAFAATRPSYQIARQSVLTPMLAQMQASQIGQTIVDLSSYANRYYTSNNGVNASNWLMQRWSALAAGRSDIVVSQFTHAAWPQKSVVVTITGSDDPSQVVVLGGHLDTINQAGTSETTRAPGADDDGSGIASLTEVLRVMVASGYRPRRTIKLIGYAAEEVGLRGSQEIAQSHKAGNANVVGVMQLDMTNYHGSVNDIYLFTDYTDSAQNSFVARLIKTYLPDLTIAYDQCGYACSDHASWSAAGYWTSMPFEAAMGEDDPYIHTANDTYARMGSQAEHSLKFARMALAYAVELGSDDGVPLPPDPHSATYTGTLSKGQSRAYGPFAVAANGNFKAVLSGTGDADLYLRKAGPASSASYDCKSDGPTSSEQCNVAYSAAGYAYVLLKGYAASSYSLTVSYP